MNIHHLLFGLLAFILTGSLLSCSDDTPSSPAELRPQFAIQSEGREILDGQTLVYHAHEDELFGDILAGHNSEPVFIPSKPCKLDVTITVPPSDIRYVQWCGLTKQCTNYEPGKSYTRSLPTTGTREAMELHTYFKKGVFTECKVKVDVKVNNRPERTFYINYIYTDK